MRNINNNKINIIYIFLRITHACEHPITFWTQVRATKQIYKE